MPFRNSSRFSRSRRSLKRSSFSRKRTFSKSRPKASRRTATIRQALMPPNMRVRFPLTMVSGSTVGLAAGTDNNIFWVGNSICPVGDATPQTISAGDELPSMIAEYSTLYERVLVHGSSIDVQINISNVTAQFGSLNCVFAPLPYCNSGASNLTNVVTDFSNLVFQDALSLPGARRFILVNNLANRNCSHRIRASKTVKSMTIVKDIEDASTATYDMVVSTDSAQLSQPANGFVWCLKLENTSGTTANVTVQIITKMMIDATMTNRIAIPQDQVV